MIDSKGYLMTPRSFIKPGLPQNVLNASGIIDIYCEEKLRRLLFEFRSKIMHPVKRVRAAKMRFLRDLSREDVVLVFLKQ